MSLLYSLFKHKETEELHIFQAKNSNGKCSILSKKSMCTVIDPKDISTPSLFRCIEEQAAREQCAKIGRAVCGNCVNTLYSN